MPFAVKGLTPVPYKTKEDRRLYDATRPARKRPSRAGKIRPFVGVDGEGGNNTNTGRHEYYLLRVGSEYITGNPLKTLDIFRFLYRECTKPVIPVAFFFDYDVTMILQDIPRNVLDKLYDRQTRTVIHANGREETHPVQWNGWEFDHLPRKEFKCRPIGSQKWATVSDVNGFYQCSFLEAITTWNIGTPEQLARIAEGKSKRSELSEVINQQEIEYNREECELLAELVSLLRSTCSDLSLIPPKWQGAGNLASAMMKKNNAPEKPKLPQEIRDAAQACYYGGRFELSMHGMYSGTIHEYDIASAYPHAMRLLPCLEHGEWYQGDGTVHPFSMYKIRWERNSTEPLTWGPFPFRRKDGSIHYPHSGTGWYWGVEVVPMVSSGKYTWTVLNSYDFKPRCTHEPFGFIPPVYAERQKLGKSDKGKILKLGLNSLYGKTAQSIGKPKYANPIYAGLITAMTRARMSELCFQHDDAIVMIATDGIYSTKELYIEAESPSLGDWEHETFQGMLFIQPGLYWSGDAVHSKTRTRGVAKSLVEAKIHEFIDQWNEHQWNGSVSFRFTRFYGLRETLHLGTPEKAGQWIEVERTISYAANDSKRIPIPSRKPGPWRSTPHQGNPNDVSAPYQKIIGGEFIEHPEYVPNELHAYTFDMIESQSSSPTDIGG